MLCEHLKARSPHRVWESARNSESRSRSAAWRAKRRGRCSRWRAVPVERAPPLSMGLAASCARLSTEAVTSTDALLLFWQNDEAAMRDSHGVFKSRRLLAITLDGAA